MHNEPGQDLIGAALSCVFVAYMRHFFLVFKVNNQKYLVLRLKKGE